MHKSGEDAVARAARHVMDGEKHVAHQEILLAELVQGGHERETVEARRVLEALQTLLRLARKHLHRVETELSPCSYPSGCP
jgi:hypothetical protein